MCNEINQSICHTKTTYEVNTFKNKNKRKSSKRYFYLSFSLLHLFIRNCKFFIIETRAYDIARNENAMISLKANLHSANLSRATDAIRWRMVFLNLHLK